MRSQEVPAFGPPESLAVFFEAALARYRPDLTPVAYARQQETGRCSLLDYHAHVHPIWSVQMIAEHRVELALLPNGIRLIGELDCLDPLPSGGYLIVDHKTGNPSNAAKYLKPALPTATTLAEWHQDDKAHGRDYWRQAVFYHLLLKHDVAQHFQPNGIGFYFLQPSTDATTTPYRIQDVHVTPEDEAAVLAQMVAVDAAVRAHDFSHACGEYSW
jgi:DNA helicase-2/ATP-dependent DNA helicase PcrA